MTPLPFDPAAVGLEASVAALRLAGPTLAGLGFLMSAGLLVGLPLRTRGALSGGGDLLAAAPGLGVMAIALGWWLADLVGLPLRQPGLVGAGALLVAAAAVALFRFGGRPSAGTLWLLALWLMAGVTRLAVVRDLALPAWVDGVHHTYITGLLLEAGGIPRDYGRLLGFGPFAYHFGFHSVVASASAVSGAPPPDAVIAVGQLLSAAAVPSAFLLARLYGASTLGALAAGATAGLVSMMPAYYVSWSRYTEMAGLVAAPGWLLLARRSGRSPPAAVLAGLAAAAMLFVHPRVAVMVGLLALVDFLIQPDRWAGKRWLALAPLVAVLAAAPWLGRLLGELVPRLGIPVEGISTANALDLAPLSTHHDPWLYGLAVAAAVAGLTAGNLGAWVLAAWLAVTFVAANPGLLGLPGTYMLSNGSVVISLWLPAAALIGRGLSAIEVGLARRVSSRAAAWGSRLAPIAVVAAGLAFGDAPLAALNPATVLATPRDRRVLGELERILPADALVAVNARDWQLRTYMGSDAGYWIGVVTPGRAIVPPVLYGLGPPDHARAISARLDAWRSSGGDPRALALQMRTMGAGWLFVGERGGTIEADRLAAEAGFVPVLVDGPVRLYRLRSVPSP